MSDRFEPWTALAALLALVALFAPLGPGTGEGETLFLWQVPVATAYLLVLIPASAWFAWRRPAAKAATLVLLGLVVLGAWLALSLLHVRGLAGAAGSGFWLLVLALWAAAWRAIDGIAEFRSLDRGVQRLVDLLVPAAFGLWLVFLWEVVTIGFGVPQVLLPPPSMIAERIAGSLDILAADFHQTFVKAVISGYLLGCGSAFIVAILVDRVPFLQRGLLPLGNLVSALPIVGIAPIMVMWFGFDWQSKAAVVVVMTFFPMLVNTIAGLNATGAMELDLMHS